MEDRLSLLDKYYDRIYVLSVREAEERRELFRERFRGLNYSFFYGADKKKFTIHEVEQQGIYSDNLARAHHRFGKAMRHGEIACSWSHRMIYEDMLEHGYERILIFEDDAVPDPHMIGRIPQILNEIPHDCELLMWGWSKGGVRGPGARIKQFIYHIQHSMGRLKWSHRIIRNLYARPFSKHIRKAGFHDYTYAYALNQNGARKLLGMQTPVQYIADNLLAHATTKGIVNGYITWPQVFLHDSLPDGTHRDSYIR